MPILKNPGPIEYDTVIKNSGRAVNSWSTVAFPYDLKELYGVGNLVPVYITFDSIIEYRGRLAKMRGPNASILIKKDIMAQLNKKPGDKIKIKVVLDEKPGDIEIPKILTDRLKQEKLFETFNKMTLSHKKEYINYINEAKKNETKLARVQKSIDMIRAKQK